MYLRPLLIAAFVAGLLGVPACGQEVSWSPPAVYAERLQPLLTPAEPLLKVTPTANEKDRDGVVVLDEELQTVTADGRRVVVEHFAGLAITDAGAETLGRQERYFQKSRHRVHLTMARTIQPDGRVQEVKRETIFTQTPQRDADEALYDDGAEVVVIFPNVKPGCMVEWITVTEETKGRIPGEYTAFQELALGWPIRKLVRRLEMPDALAARLKVTPLGGGVPQPVRVSEKGYTSWKWERSGVPALHWETGRPPLDQKGPGIFLTTLPDWNAFLRWYVPLATPRMVLNDRLKALADEWTKDAKSPREIAERINARVANDVRYVGLEFDDCDLEPHQAAEVWEHQYGDCKDKASLLCALLRHKGLTAHMALVNTAHAGRVERRSPDFRHFNHAICVALLPDGPLFIDPTVSGAPAGMLPPGDIDRDVLLVKEPEQWLRTPSARAGSYNVDVEMEMAPDGGLSGWLTLRATGYISVIFSEYERTGTKDQLRARMGRIAEGRFPGARVVDLAPSKRDTAGSVYEARAYFTVPGTGAPALRFPYTASMLPDAGETAERQTDLMTWLEDQGTASTITLPPGFRAELPRPLTLDSPYVSMRAAWEKTEKGVKATLEYKPKVARIPAGDCAAFDRSTSTLRAWLSKQPALVLDGKPRPAAPEGKEELEMPVMPSGEGQLALVEEKYPEEGNLGLRRKALEKAITLFPDDAATRFNGTVQLAWVDIREQKYDAALACLKGPLETGKTLVPAENYGLAEYAAAYSLRMTGKTVESLSILDRLAVDTALSPYRRAWSQNQRAMMLKGSDREKSLAALREGLTLPSGAESELLLLLADLLITGEDGSAFAKELHAWLEKEPGNESAVLVALAKMAGDWVQSEPARAGALVDVLSTAAEGKPPGAEFTQALAAARSTQALTGVSAEIAPLLQAFLAEHPELVPEEEIPANLTSVTEYETKMAEVMNVDTIGASSVAWMLEFMRRFPTNPGFASALQKAASLQNVREDRAGEERAGALLRQLLMLTDRLPKGSAVYLESRYVRAKVLARTGKREEAIALFKTLAANEVLSVGFRCQALYLAGDLAVAMEDAATALELWTGGGELTQAYSSADCLFKATLLLLETGKAGDVWPLLEQLRALPPEVLEKCSLGGHLNPFLKYTENRAEAEAWWAASANWWPRWRALEKKLGVDEGTGKLVVPAIASTENLGTEIATAEKNGNHRERTRLLGFLAHAARWSPEMAVEITGLGPVASQFGLTGKLLEYFRMSEAVCTSAPVSDPVLARKILFNHIVSVSSQAKSPEVLKIAEKFRAIPAEPDGLTGAGARLRSMAAIQTKKEREESLVELKMVLEKNVLPEDRHLNVRCLADLYAAMDRQQEEVELLARSLEEEDVKKSASFNAFTTRLEKLRKKSAEKSGETKPSEAQSAP